MKKIKVRRVVINLETDKGELEKEKNDFKPNSWKWDYPSSP